MNLFPVNQIRSLSFCSSKHAIYKVCRRTFSSINSSKLLLSSPLRRQTNKINRYFIRSFQNLLYRPIESLKFNTVCNKLSIYKINKRFMKRLANTSNLTLENKGRLIGQAQETINSLYAKPINHKMDLLNKITNVFITPSEHIVNQTLLKGCHSRISYKKNEMIEAVKNQTMISNKLTVEDAREKSDVRFIPELLISSRYSETSHIIKEVKLNSENNLTNNLISKIQTGNMRADTEISYNFQNQTQNFSVYRDIKSGNNMFNITKGFLGEVPYCEDGRLYNIINQPNSLKEINEQRLQYLKTLLEKQNNLKHDPYIQININIIESLKPLLLQGEIIYNNAVQNQLYALMALEKKLNFSIYYGIIVKETKYNQDFYDKLYPHLSTDMFDNKKAFNIFMAKAVIIYHDTVSPILNNIEKTRNTEWEASFIDQINNDIFN